MKLPIITALLFFSVSAFSQSDYRIQINDTTLEIGIDTTYTVNIDGKDINFKLMAKDTLFYDGGLFSFNYLKDYKITRLEIESGIDQIMLVTAEGTGFIIQKYSTFNPTMLNELMLTEVTKESLNYGYKMKRQKYTKKLSSGQKLQIDKAILTYKGETNTYEVASIGEKDEGILIMTMVMDEEMGVKGKKMIDLMWNSLRYK